MFTLLQSATGPAVPLLQIAEERHRAYCAARAAAYVCNYDDFGGSPYWHKVHLIRAWLATAPGGTLGVWLDADAWIADTACDVRVAAPQGVDLAAYRMSGCLHTGVLFVRAGALVRDWFDALWGWADRTKYLDYHISKFYVINPAPRVHSLPYAWHGNGCNPPPGPRYIAALHGRPRNQAAAIMQEAMKSGQAPA